MKMPKPKLESLKNAEKIAKALPNGNGRLMPDPEKYTSKMNKGDLNDQNSRSTL